MMASAMASLSGSTDVLSTEVIVQSTKVARGDQLRITYGVSMRRIKATCRAACIAACLITAPGAVTSAAAQSNIPAALAGGVAGAGSGGYIAIAVIVAESRGGKYLHSYHDALGWRSAPVLIGGATGVFLGATAPDRLWRTVLYGGVGTVAGTGAGIVAGKLVWDGPEAKWAGGAIGAGVGMAIGSSLGVFLPMHKKTDSTEPVAQSVRTRIRENGIPVSFTIRF
jgi:hypothetical protein